MTEVRPEAPSVARAARASSPARTQYGTIVAVVAAWVVATTSGCANGRADDSQRADPIDGRWAGVATAFGATGPITLDLVTRDDSLHAAVTMNVEALYVDRPLVNVRYRPPAIHFEFEDFRGNNGIFDGVRHRDTITGVTRKNRHQVDMRFQRVSRTIPSSPYRRESIGFQSADGTRLEGTLFTPPSHGPHPVVVLLHGSGPSVREDLYYLADRFTRAGIAAFAYDKRGSGRSLGNADRASYQDFANDARAAIEAVGKRPAIDPHRIGLCGTSEGGWVASIVAANDAKVAFVISIVGPGTIASSNALYQNVGRLKAAGASPSNIARYQTMAMRVNDFARRLKGGNGSQPGAQERQMLQAALGSLNAERWDSVTDLPSRLPSQSDLTSLRWRMLDFDPAPYWKRVRAPVLLVFAARDRNINTAESSPRTKAALASGGNRDVSEIVFSRVEHDLMLSPESTEGFRFPEPVPGYPDSIIAWSRRIADRKARLRPAE